MSMETQCLCKQLTIKVSGPPKSTIVCYCSHCRLNSGYFCQLISQYELSNLDIVDPHHLVKELELNDTDSGQPKYKYFCSGCGITLYTRPLHLGGDIACVRVSMFSSCDHTPTRTIFANNKTDYVKKCM